MYRACDKAAWQCRETWHRVGGISSCTIMTQYYGEPTRRTMCRSEHPVRGNYGHPGCLTKTNVAFYLPCDLKTTASVGWTILRGV